MLDNFAKIFNNLLLVLSECIKSSSKYKIPNLTHSIENRGEIQSIPIILTAEIATYSWSLLQTYITFLIKWGFNSYLKIKFRLIIFKM